MHGSKRAITLLAIATILFLSLPGAAAAEGAPALAIDTANRYAGMDKAWGQGYLPTVSRGKASVVLPLLLDPVSSVTGIAGDTITVRPDFGDPSGSPFVFSNIEKQVKRAAHAVNGTSAAVQCWLLSFSFSLESHRTNGRYPLTFHVSYALPDGTAAAQDFTVFVTIKDGINPYATPKPAPTPAPTAKPQPQPKLILSGYDVDPQVVQAGSAFTLRFKVKNTSETVNVRNIGVTVKSEDTDLQSGGKPGSLYVKSLAKSAEIGLSCDMKAAFDAQPKPHLVTVSVSYEDYDGTAYTAAGELYVQVTQAVRIEFDQPQIPDAVNAGDTIPVSLNVFNLGKNTLNNVMCKLSAPGLLPEGSAFLGNMEPGSAKTAQIYVFVGTLDMSLDKDGNVAKDTAVTQLYGRTSGSINVTYEDEFGNPMNQQVALGTTINEPVTPTATSAPEGEAPEAGQWWVSVIAAGAIVAAGGCAAAALRRKRRKEAEGRDEAD